jgi:glycosyltransferase involved in cell wall biosynthesis
MLATKFYATSDMGGGLERSARQLFQHLLANGHRVMVLTRNYDRLKPHELIDGVEVHRFPIWGRARVTVSLSYFLQSLWWLVRHRRDYDVIHCHQSYAPATIGALARLVVGKPVVVKVSTADQFSERRELERLRLFRLRRFLLRRVDRFVMVNRAAQEEFAGLGIQASRMVHIPNGVRVPEACACDPAVRREARRRLALPEGFLVVSIGRLSAEKNLSTLIEAWPLVLRRFPAAHLALVGDGGTFRSVEAELRQQVARMGLEGCVRFTGRVADVLGFLLASDVFVLPSSTEGMSNALLEAMAAGVAIVATRIPGNCAVIAHGEQGLLVEPRDPHALAEAIVQLLAFPERASQLARAARQRAEERFALPRVGEAYRALYAELSAGVPA